jgi:membrane fusion protein, copper/silver efflux system
MLRAGQLTLGPRTSAGYLHMYCPMVPGGGGDWMQRKEPLRNPYWGSEMLECGEVVARHPEKAEVGQ